MSQFVGGPNSHMGDCPPPSSFSASFSPSPHWFISAYGFFMVFNLLVLL